MASALWQRLLIMADLRQFIQKSFDFELTQSQKESADKLHQFFNSTNNCFILKHHGLKKRKGKRWPVEILILLHGKMDITEPKVFLAGYVL